MGLKTIAKTMNTHANTSLEIRSESLYDRVRGPTQRLPLNLNPNADTQLGLHSLDQVNDPSINLFE